MYIILINIAIICIIFLVFILYNNKKNKDFIYGTWIGDSEFLNESELDEAILIIDEDEMALTITTGGEEIENSITDYEIKRNISSLLSSIKTYNLYLENSEFLPNELLLTLNKDKGELTIEDDDKVYLVLYKTYNL